MVKDRLSHFFPAEHNMTITEAMVKKKDLEKSILIGLLTFEEATGLIISDLTLEHTNQTMEQEFVGSVCKIDLEIKIR